MSSKIQEQRRLPFLNAGINLTSYHPPPRADLRATNLFPSKFLPPGQLFSAKTPAPGRKNETKIPTPGAWLAQFKCQDINENGTLYKSNFFLNFP